MPTPDSIVSVAEMKRACAQLLEHIESLGIDEVRLPHDYYWFVEKGDAYDPATVPGQLSLGQLTDDLGEVLGTLAGTNPPVALTLVRLASVLRCVGEQVNG